MILKDVAVLSKAHEDDKLLIFQMRANPNNLKILELKNKKISIDFELQIPNLDKWNLFQTIESAQKTFLKSKADSNDPDFF